MDASQTPLWASIPFAGLLLAIAVFPIFAPHFWEKKYCLIASLFALPTIFLYMFYFQRSEVFAHTLHEYTSFIALMGALFIVTGGILIHVHRPATPWTNVGILFLGAVIANVFGTTGASVLLIRPYLRMNKGRTRPFHVVFFIFIVSNVGGLLTPIGDPPLYLGYLRGVPFTWTLEYLWLHWVSALLPLLAIFLVLDLRVKADPGSAPPGMTPGHKVLDIRGKRNFLLLFGILGCVFLEKSIAWPWPQLGMLCIGLLSLFISPKGVHQDNDFNFHPIQEVAILFAAIFVTMIPALEYLETHAAQMGLNTPGQFFWYTGTLSAFLDNAPTYLAFLASAMGMHHLPMEGSMDAFLVVGASLLEAISVGAVFFGACTYIGNGPNFLVKSIAEKSGVSCPKFLGYIVRYAVPVLIPLYLIQWFIFFR